MNNLQPNLNNAPIDKPQRLQESTISKDSTNEKPAEFEYKEGSSLNLNPAAIIGQSLVKPHKKEKQQIFEEFEQTKQFLLTQKCFFLNEQLLNAPVFNDYPERIDRLNQFVKLAKEINVDLIKNANLAYFLKEDNFDFVMNYISLNPETTTKELNIEISEFKRNQERALISETETKNIKNPMIKEIATEAFLRMRLCAHKFEDIEVKLLNVKDPKVLDYVNKLFSEMKKALKTSDIFYAYDKSLEKIETCLDIYHTMNGNYEYIGDSSDKDSYSQKRKYIDFVKKNPDADKFLHTKLENYAQEQNSASNDYSLYDSADEGKWKDLLNESKLERLRDFCENFPDDKISDYFYNEYYLKNQNIPKIFAEKLEKINQNFNTKVFLSHANVEKAAQELDFVYDELSQWKKHSNGKAKFPPVLDLSKIKQDYIDKSSAYGQSASAGYAKQKTKYIAINGYKNLRYALRHELMHANDLKQGMYFAPKYDLSDIMPKKIENGEKVPDFENCKYQNEFLRAGINPEHIKYAYNNIKEFIAVASEGDMSKYSPWFKEILVDFGMPEWAFNLEVFDTEKKQRANEIDAILKMNKKADIGVPYYKVHKEINKFNTIKLALQKYPNIDKTAESIYAETLEIYNDVYDLIPEELNGDGIADRIVKDIIRFNLEDLVNDKFDKQELLTYVKIILEEDLKNEPKEKLKDSYFAYNIELLEEFNESYNKYLKKFPELNSKYDPALIYKTQKEISRELKALKKAWLEDNIFNEPEDIISVLNGTFDLQKYIEKLTK